MSVCLRLSKGFGIARCSDPDGNSRSKDRQGADCEGELIVPRAIEQVSGQEWADEPTQSAAAVREAKNRTKMATSKEVRRDRR